MSSSAWWTRRDFDLARLGALALLVAGVGGCANNDSASTSTFTECIPFEDGGAVFPGFAANETPLTCAVDASVCPSKAQTLATLTDFCGSHPMSVAAPIVQASRDCAVRPACCYQATFPSCSDVSR